MPDPRLALVPPGRGPLHGLRILVVEDEYVAAEDIGHHLRLQGVEVLGPAPSVERALALLAGGWPDAAILDINLGGRMAFAVADALSARGVPFLFATGYDAWAIPEAYAAVPVCEKPFDVRRCLRLLGRAVEAA